MRLESTPVTDDLAGNRHRRAAAILVVDDHDAVRTSLQAWLEVEFPHCEVLTASCGEDALELAYQRQPQVLIMDITLPGMNGIEATRRVKALCPSTRVIILSIHDSENHRADAHAAGADAYVSKATMQSTLVSVLETCLHSHEPP
jgi:DNA-binding NarL/FixJ family response regulator